MLSALTDCCADITLHTVKWVKITCFVWPAVGGGAVYVAMVLSCSLQQHMAVAEDKISLAAALCDIIAVFAQFYCNKFKTSPRGLDI